MKVERSISWFSKVDGKLAGEIIIDDNINLQDLKEIFEVYENDPLMYMAYDIKEPEAKKLKKFISFEFDFEQFNYELNCFQAGT